MTRKARPQKPRRASGRTRAGDNLRHPPHRQAPATPRSSAAPKRPPLTPRERRFIDEYLVDLNATQAAIRAGYSERSAASIGSENLKKPEIAAAVATALEARATRTGITQDRVLEELALLAFSDVTHYRVSDAGNVTLAAGAPAGAMRAVSSIKRRITTRGRGEQTEVVREVEIRLWEKPGPLKLAGQHVGLFTEKVQLEAGGDLVDLILTAAGIAEGEKR